MLCHILGTTKWAMHVSTIGMGKGTIVDTVAEYCIAFEGLPTLTANIPLFAPSKSGIYFWDGE